MENDEIVSEDQAVATILNDYFRNITKSLNIADNNENVATGDEIPDPVTGAIEKYRSHPSVMLIKSHYEAVEFSTLEGPQLQRFLSKLITSILRRPRLLVVFPLGLLKIMLT